MGISIDPSDRMWYNIEWARGSQLMTKRVLLLFLLTILLLLLGLAVQRWTGNIGDPDIAPTLRQFSDRDFYQTQSNVEHLDSLHPIPYLKQLTPGLQARVNLGRQLFHDARLSGNGEISCSTCHQLEHGGHDPRTNPVGISQRTLRRNTPTVYNAAFNIAQFWDGRAEDLTQQAAIPVLHPDEMGGDWVSITHRLRSDPEMVRAFSIYPQGIREETIVDAIALYERTLITANSPLDRYLRGADDALNKTELEGYELFKTLGCISCHQGKNLGSNLFQKIGVYANDQQLASLSSLDQGRFEVTGEEKDRLVFKVPSLRNVALTAPYFHDGSRATLKDAVYDMGQLQLGITLSPEQIDKITAFLHTLTGKLVEGANR